MLAAVGAGRVIESVVKLVKVVSRWTINDNLNENVTVAQAIQGSIL